MKKNNLIYILILSGVLLSCKTTELTTKTINNKLPKNYVLNNDSASAKLLKWRELIFDKHLVSIIDTALKHNFDLKIALQKIEISRAGIKFAKGRLPIGASALERNGEYTMDGVGNYDTKFSTNINDKQQIPNPLPDYYVGLQASWEIDLWGKLKNKKRAAASKFIASQYGKDLIITNLVAEISTTYFELLALDNEIKILENNIILQQDALDIVTIQKQTGKSNELGE
ncbi:MAG: TolC family protein [Bacteroidetes bacterium]|nr:TolC family protein [Bacteroidota bacterium]